MFKSIARLRRDEKIIFFITVILTVLVFYFINKILVRDGMIFWGLVEIGIMWVDCMSSVTTMR